MEINILFLAILLLISFFPYASANIAAFDAQCAKYPEEQCAINKEGNFRTVTLGNETFECKWLENEARCGVGKEKLSSLQSILEFFDNPTLNWFLLLLLPLSYLVVLALYFKFGKDKLIKIFNAVKILAALFVYSNIFYPMHHLVQILIVIVLLQPVITFYSVWRTRGEDKRIKAAFVWLLFVELLFAISLLIVPFLTGGKLD